MEQSIPIQPTVANLQTRVTNILARPKQEWPVIASEPRDVASVYRNYVVLLAAIPAVCGLVGMSLVGVYIPFYGYSRVGLASAIVYAVLRYVLALVAVYVAGFIVAKLAPSFQSEADVPQAVKLVAYSMTPGWVAGVLLLYPALSPLVALAALYGIYIMYVGFTPMLKTPADKVIGYLVVSAIVTIVVYFVLGMIVASIAAPFAFAAAARPAF